jgi:hypothetical protein
MTWLGRGRPAPLVDPEPDLEVELETFDGPLEQLPRTRAEVYRVFGNPGVGKVEPSWERASMVAARNLPGRWNKGAGKLYVHRLAEPYVREALRRCQVLGVVDELLQVGCWNFRHQRHDAARPLSYHSWGIAVDINSAANAGWYVKSPPEPWSPEWLEHYPAGLSYKVVRAFESCGWKWGGRWKSFVDPMHFELTG